MKCLIKISLFILLFSFNYYLLVSTELPQWGKVITEENPETTQTPAQSTLLFAQVDTLKENNQADTVKPKPLKDFVSDAPVSKKTYVMTKSPTTAVLLSLLLPGAGQLYNESYWKAPLFLGATGVLTYLILDNHNKYSDEQNKYDKMSASDPNRSQSKVIKEYYRDQRDQDIFYLSGVYIFAAVDAYVGAHLFDFNVSDELTLKFRTDYNQGFRVGFMFEW
ncbi:hypothetical protein D9V86_07390 [Bacteroidetes/Chlorobi group bacterium ChocPot_Mid]|nr:MAG: hypothetical protein D9V86_07390 [Bacteroidetes/Chlorobi group bacterium ChocPot_Mid]